MNIIILQAILATTHFVGTLICAVAPVKIVRKKPGKDLSTKSQRIISFCNCLSGGVFLSTCFVGLIPFVRTKFRAVLGQVHLQDVNYPFAEVTVCLGYFLILIIEMCTHSFQKNNHTLLEEEPMVEIPNDIPNHFMDISSPSDMDSGDELSPGEDHHLTKPLQKVRKTKPVATQPHSPHHDHRHDHSHGHSHLSAVVQQTFNLRSVLLYIALSIHSIFEGLALGLQTEGNKLLNLFAAVFVHECLVSFAMGINLAKNSMSNRKLFLLVFLFCLTIPVGMLIGAAIGGIQTVAGGLASASIQGIAAGTFIYVVFHEILPEELNEPSNRWLKTMFLFIGFLVIACLRVTLIHQQE